MAIPLRLLIGLVLLAVVDTILPVPITALFLFYVLFYRPPWFAAAVDRVYGRGPSGEGER